MGPTFHGRHGPRKPPEQGRRNNDVLACPGEVWEGFVVLEILRFMSRATDACSYSSSSASAITSRLVEWRG